MKYLLSLCLCLLAKVAVPNDSILITQLLQKIEQLQVKEDGLFPKGSIPSYRKYALNPDRFKADINPFYTGLTAFTLLNIRDELTINQKTIADTIIQRTRHTFTKFENRKKNGLTYNFWPTDRPQIFPNSGWVNWLDKSKALPDDLDDTVIILMALNANDSIAIKIHNLMQGYTNSTSKTINNTYEEFKKLNAYSTWFGEKMPIDFDVCVMSNVLYFVQHYNLNWTHADSATLKVIVESIKTNKHLKNAEYISAQYAKPSIIFYHISRLMAKKKIQELEDLKPQLIKQALEAIQSTDSFLEKILMSTSLLRWGMLPPKIVIKSKTDLTSMIEDEESFAFFIASVGGIYPNYIKNLFFKTKIAFFYYHCPAFNNLLVLENLIWHKKLVEQNQ